MLFAIEQQQACIGLYKNHTNYQFIGRPPSGADLTDARTVLEAVCCVQTPVATVCVPCVACSAACSEHGCLFAKQSCKFVELSAEGSFIAHDLVAVC